MPDPIPTDPRVPPKPNTVVQEQENPEVEETQEDQSEDQEDQ